MRYSLILILILGICQFVVFAQNSAEKSGCPNFSVFGPSAAVSYDKPLSFHLDVDKELSRNTKINWTVSGGKILSGQGTESITIETFSDTGLEITAIVELIGLPENCPKIASASQIFCSAIPLSEKMDEFGKVTKKILAEKIGNLSKKLKDDPSATASIIKSVTNRTNKLYAYRDLQLMLGYLESDGIDKTRISFQISFSNNEISELWFIPAGAIPPSSDAKYENLDAVELKRKIIELSKKQ